MKHSFFSVAFLYRSSQTEGAFRLSAAVVALDQPSTAEALEAYLKIHGLPSSDLHLKDLIDVTVCPIRDGNLNRIADAVIANRASRGLRA